MLDKKFEELDKKLTPLEKEILGCYYKNIPIPKNISENDFEKSIANLIKYGLIAKK